VIVPDGPRYDDDFYAWTQYQADVLRSLPTSDNRFDREHVAEEIEDLGKNERDTVESQITRVLEHFLKLTYSPADRPRFGWMRSIVEARGSLRKKVSPSLLRTAQDDFPALYLEAREQARLALREYGGDNAAASLPSESPFTLDQVLHWGWYPDAAPIAAIPPPVARQARRRKRSTPSSP
jgi:hypothetical protein